MKIPNNSIRLLPLFVALASLMGQISGIQARQTDSIQWRAQLNLNAGGGTHTPYWLTNNTYGMGSIEKNNGFLRASFVKNSDRDKKWSWGAGADITGGFRQTSPFHIQQLYGEIRFRCLDLMVGAKEMPGEGTDPDLSTGNLLLGTNARPVPQVRAGIFDFANIWGLRGWLAIKGYVAFGKYADSRWINNWIDKDLQPTYAKGVWYHSKGVWLRNGNPAKFPLTFEVGIEMATQFGGESWFWDAGKYHHIKNPGGLKAFWKALVPLAGDDDTPSGETTNIQGNFLGNWTYALQWKPTGKDWGVRAYYQHMFEDHSMLYIEYPWRDGMWGIEATFPKNRFVSKAVYEFVHFKDQSGPVYWDRTDKIPAQVSERDNYYQHYIYGAWQNYGQLMGNALAISPIYNNPHTMNILSSRFIAHHLGVQGQPTSELSYRLLCTFSRHWGTYTHPLPEIYNSFNFLAQVTWTPAKLKGWEGSLAAGVDAGHLLGNSAGVQISISKTGFINF